MVVVTKVLMISSVLSRMYNGLYIDCIVPVLAIAEQIRLKCLCVTNCTSSLIARWLDPNYISIHIHRFRYFLNEYNLG